MREKTLKGKTMSKAKKQKTESENSEIHYDPLSVEAVSLVLRSFFRKNQINIDDVSERLARFISCNDDYRNDVRDEAYFIRREFSNECVRVWVKLDNHHVVVRLDHALDFKYGMTPVIEKNEYGCERHHIQQVFPPNIGYFKVRSLSTVFDDFMAMLDDGPYSFDKCESEDHKGLYYQYGNIHRSKSLDGYAVLAEPEGMDEAKEIYYGRKI